MIDRDLFILIRFEWWLQFGGGEAAAGHQGRDYSSCQPSHGVLNALPCRHRFPPSDVQGHHPGCEKVRDAVWVDEPSRRPIDADLTGLSHMIRHRLVVRPDNKFVCNMT
jgi:hypothetical protein